MLCYVKGKLSENTRWLLILGAKHGAVFSIIHTYLQPLSLLLVGTLAMVRIIVDIVDRLTPCLKVPIPNGRVTTLYL